MANIQGEATPWLTQTAYDRLTKNLEYLCGPGRQEITNRLESARAEGDVSENGAFDAAAEEQSKHEGRILELRELLEAARVGDVPPDNGVVEMGMMVTATVDGNEMRFLFGNRHIAEGQDDLDVFSESSPLGGAIHGASAGDTVTYTAPNGRDVEVRIGAVTPYEDDGTASISLPSEDQTESSQH